MPMLWIRAKIAARYFVLADEMTRDNASTIRIVSSIEAYTELLI
jgi:hypothetical protein